MYRNNVFHIGFSKAASTFLQLKIFPNIPTHSFVNNDADGFRRDVDNLPRQFSTRYFVEHPEIINMFKNLDTPFVYSSESFLNIDEHPAKYNEQGWGPNCPIARSNLLKVLETVNGLILVVLRCQDNAVESYYKSVWRYFHGEDELFIDFPHWQDHPISNRVRSFTKRGMLYLSTFDHYNILMSLANAIGKSRIRVLLYEDLVYRPEQFLTQLEAIFETDLKHLTEYMSTRANPAPKKTYLRRPCARRIVDFAPFFTSFIDRFPKLFYQEKDKLLSERFRRDLMDIYAPGNKRVANFFGLDSQRYGYY